MNIPPQHPGKGAASDRGQRCDDQSVKSQRREGRDDRLVPSDLNAKKEQKSPDQNRRQLRRPGAAAVPQKPPDRDSA